MAAERGMESRVAVLVLVAVVVIAAGCGSTKTVTETVTVSSTAKTGLGPPQERVEYGHITSLVRAGDHFVLRFDPALLLSGIVPLAIGVAALLLLTPPTPIRRTAHAYPDS